MGASCFNRGEQLRWEVEFCEEKEGKGKGEEACVKRHDLVCRQARVMEGCCRIVAAFLHKCQGLCLGVQHTAHNTVFASASNPAGARVHVTTCCPHFI